MLYESLTPIAILAGLSLIGLLVLWAYAKGTSTAYGRINEQLKAGDYTATAALKRAHGGKR